MRAAPFSALIGPSSYLDGHGTDSAGGERHPAGGHRLRARPQGGPAARPPVPRLDHLLLGLLREAEEPVGTDLPVEIRRERALLGCPSTAPSRCGSWSTIAVYARAGDNPFVTRFSIAGNGGIDAVSDTDGIDVTSADAGPGFERGLLVAHDAANSGASTSNLKYVPLDQILDLTPPPT